MSEKNKIHIIDAGNTSLKVAQFENHSAIDLQRFNYNETGKINERLTAISTPVAITSVLSEKDTKKISDRLNSPFIITSDTPVPIQMNYETNETLGMDRLCNAVAASSIMESEYGIAIDIGTCVKFDLVHSSMGYMGGSISPGIQLRFNALNDYTGKLPRLSNKSGLDLVGTDTATSIRSGVINGLNAEINGFMEQYRERFKDLTFFISGGDANFFDIHTKNDIFADENLTLKGLYEIYRHNA